MAERNNRPTKPNKALQKRHIDLAARQLRILTATFKNKYLLDDMQITQLYKEQIDKMKTNEAFKKLDAPPTGESILENIRRSMRG